MSANSEFSSAKYRLSPNFNLPNVGNTCYLNSAIQCIVATYEITKLLFSKRGSRVAKHNLRRASSEDEKIYTQYKRLLRNLHNHDWIKAPKMVYPPDEMMRVMGRLVSERMGQRFGVQLDAGETIDLILRSLDGIVSVPIPRDYLEFRDTLLRESDQDQPEVKLVLSELDGLIGDSARGFSLLHRSTFDGMRCTKRMCATCGLTSFHSQPFSVFTLDTLYTATGGVYLEDALTATAEMDFQEEAKCSDGCGSLGVNVWCGLLHEPRVLIISTARSTSVDGKIVKINTPLILPEKLRMSDTKCLMVSGEEFVNGQGIYELYALVLHTGYSSQMGHYVSLTKDHADERWYVHDDEQDTPVEDIRSLLCGWMDSPVRVPENVSMCFYRKIN